MDKPWIPRLHLWEIDDQPWFPSFLRAFVQTGLTHAWTTHLPVLQPSSPATLVADTLRRVLGSRRVSRHTYIDFCAGAGGPTPSIERALNKQLAGSSATSPSTTSSSSSSSSSDLPTRHQVQVPATASSGIISGEPQAASRNTPSYAAVANPRAKSDVVVAATSSSSISSSEIQDADRDGNNGNVDDDADDDGAVDFVLTDLHPHVESWEAASKKSDRLTYIARPVDAACAPPELLRRYGRGKNGEKEGGEKKKKKKGIFRLFNLAFHHFDDDLARAILKNTVETSEGFGIFELQERSLTGLLTCFLFGFFIFLIAPLLYWWSPMRLFWVYVIPVVPFVLVFDGLISCLRTRTAAEVETLLRTCGADSSDWEVKSGKEQFLWPVGNLSWIIATKKTA